MGTVAFKVYDMDRDGYISNGELFLVLKMMVGNNLKDQQLQQIVDKTIMEADQDGDGKINFEEFKAMVANTDIAKQMTLDGMLMSDLSLTYCVTWSQSDMADLVCNIQIFSEPLCTDERIPIILDQGGHSWQICWT